MESTNGLITTSPATGATSRHGATQSDWLGGRRRWAVAGLVFAAVTGLVLSQHWLSIADLVPLLFVLPCMAMMFMCIKGMNHGRHVDSTTEQGSSGDGTPTATDPRN